MLLDPTPVQVAPPPLLHQALRLLRRQPPLHQPLLRLLLPLQHRQPLAGQVPPAGRLRPNGASAAEQVTRTLNFLKYCYMFLTSS